MSTVTVELERDTESLLRRGYVTTQGNVAPSFADAGHAQPGPCEPVLYRFHPRVCRPEPGPVLVRRDELPVLRARRVRDSIHQSVQLCSVTALQVNAGVHVPRVRRLGHLIGRLRPHWRAVRERGAVAVSAGLGACRG